MFACSFVGSPIFLDIAACFSARKRNAKSPSEESIFFHTGLKYALKARVYL